MNIMKNRILCILINLILYLSLKLKLTYKTESNDIKPCGLWKCVSLFYMCTLYSSLRENFEPVNFSLHSSEFMYTFFRTSLKLSSNLCKH